MYSYKGVLPGMFVPVNLLVNYILSVKTTDVYMYKGNR